MSSSTRPEPGKPHPRTDVREKARAKPRGVHVEQPRPPTLPPEALDPPKPQPTIADLQAAAQKEANELLVRFVGESARKGSKSGALKYLRDQLAVLIESIDRTVLKLDTPTLRAVDPPEPPTTAEAAT
jgi:hypothetical protein